MKPPAGFKEMIRPLPPIGHGRVHALLEAVSPAAARLVAVLVAGIILRIVLLMIVWVVVACLSWCCLSMACPDVLSFIRQARNSGRLCLVLESDTCSSHMHYTYG